MHGFWLRLATLCAVAGVVYQCVFTAPDGAAFASAVDRLEATALEATPAASAVPVMAAAETRLTVEAAEGHLRRAVLLKNSRPVATFAAGRAVVAVSPGDLLEIDGRAYRRRLVFRVVGSDPGLAAPAVGEEVATVGDIAVLTRVRARG